MIVSWDKLPELAGAVVMVDGSFDPLHEGHIAYFAAAERLGMPVLCNITSDKLTVAKHPVLLPQSSRSLIIGAIRHISYVHCATEPTVDVLQQLRPHAYIKGMDWFLRGGVPAVERECCQRLGIEICYVDTVLNSSTKLLEQFRLS